MRNKLNKVKLFIDNDITKLEKKINSWFNENKYIEVVQILQSENTSNAESKSSEESWNCTITILYKEIEEPSSTITKPTDHKGLSKKTGRLEFLNEEFHEIDG